MNPVSEKTPSRLRYDQFNIRMVLLAVTLCALLLAMGKAFGPIVWIVMPFVSVLLVQAVALKAIENARQPDSQASRSVFGFALKVACLICLALGAVLGFASVIRSMFLMG